jgi:hypothetical protein
MSIDRREAVNWVTLLSIAAIFVVLGMMLMNGGVYGLALFVVAPFAVGAMAESAWNSASLGRAAGTGAFAVFVVSLMLFATGREGAICIVMFLPLGMPLGVLGAWASQGYRWSRERRDGITALLLLLPLSAGTLGFDLTAKPPVFEAKTSVEIAAAPEKVWKYVVSFSEMAPPEEWFFKAGVAYPERVGITGSGAGATRHCEFSTGAFVEPIEIWDEPRLLQFSVTESPASMREWSFYRDVTPKHLHGYLVSKRGQFRLTPLPNGHTLLEGTSWYQNGFFPAQYWRLWSDAIVHRVHLRVLNNIRTLAEGSS